MRNAFFKWVQTLIGVEFSRFPLARPTAGAWISDPRGPQMHRVIIKMGGKEPKLKTEDQMKNPRNFYSIRRGFLFAGIFWMINPMVCFSDVYDDFNTYCQTNFGAEIEPLVYEKFGQSLKFQSAGDWVHESETSAAIGFETNLPAHTFVEYGKTTAYGSQTSLADRRYYNHLHYLKNLSRNSLYHYRLVATDERGNRIYSEDRTFETGDIPGAIYLPGAGSLSGPPFVLDQANAVYVLLEDVVSETAGFSVQANGVTVDLNGHTVIYDDGAPIVYDTTWDKFAYNNQSSYGIHSVWKYGDMKFLNGILKQGRNNGKGHLGDGFSPVRIINNGGLTEVAGITAEYRGDDLAGINVQAPDTYVHHNVIIDRGTVITNRHMALRSLQTNKGIAPVHHNLIKRARHRGLNPGSSAHSNEIYMDTFDTNAFGLSPQKGGEYFNNKIFGTGYHVVGLSWNSDIHVHDNFIHLQGEAPNNRSAEYGAECSVNGMRLTQYEDGKTPYENNLYERNVIVVKGRNGTNDTRGVQFSSDPNVKNLVFRDNIVRAIAMDDKTTNDTYHEVACVVTQGIPSLASFHEPIVFENNRLISNVLMVRYMDSYGGGSNQDFKNCTFVREGNDSRFKVFRVGWWYWDTINNDVISCRYEGGANPDQYLFDGTGRRELNFGHHLWVRAENQAGRPIVNQKIEALDAVGHTYTGQTDSAGVARLDLIDYTLFAASGSATPIRIGANGHYARIPQYHPTAITPAAMMIRDNAANPHLLTFIPLGSTPGELDDLGTSVNVIKKGVSDAAYVNVNLSQENLVQIDIVSRNGKVRALLNQTLPAGQHVIPWDGKNDDGADVASGIYSAHVQFGGKKKKLKISVVR